MRKNPLKITDVTPHNEHQSPFAAYVCAEDSEALIYALYLTIGMQFLGHEYG